MRSVTTTVSSIVSAPIIHTKVPFDVDRELTFVSQIATVPMILGVHPSIPVDTAPELMQYLRRNKGKLSYGSVAVGHYGHVASAHIDASTPPAKPAWRTNPARARRRCFRTCWPASCRCAS